VNWKQAEKICCGLGMSLLSFQSGAKQDVLFASMMKGEQTNIVKIASSL
jgi:hypothetical protein